MFNLKQPLLFLALGSVAPLMIMTGSALAESRSEPLIQITLIGGQSIPDQVRQNQRIEAWNRSKDDDDNDWDDDDDVEPIIRISGRVIRFGERYENECIVEANGRRYRVDAGPRWWRNLPVSVGDQLTVEGELDDGELDAFWVQLANGETVQLRGRSGPPPWSGGRRRSR